MPRLVLYKKVFSRKEKKNIQEKLKQRCCSYWTVGYPHSIYEWILAVLIWTFSTILQTWSTALCTVDNTADTQVLCIRPERREQCSKWFNSSTKSAKSKAIGTVSLGAFLKDWQLYEVLNSLFVPSNVMLQQIRLSGSITWSLQCKACSLGRL